MEVLLDTYSKKGNQLSGRTRCHRVVNVTADNGLLGQLVKVKVKEALAHSLRGEVVS